MTHIQCSVYGVFLDFVMICTTDTSPICSEIFHDVTRRQIVGFKVHVKPYAMFGLVFK